MEPVLIAAIRFIDATNGPRKTELERLQELKSVVEFYRSAHQGVSDSSSKRRISSSSIRLASA